MIRTTLAAAAAAAAAAAVLLGVTAPADAAAHHPRSGDPLYENCISYAEFHTMGGGTMREVEAAIGATGVVVHTENGGRTVVKQYRACGLYRSQGFYQIGYFGPIGNQKAQDVTMFDFRDLMAHQPDARI